MAETLFSFPTPFTPPTTEEDRLSALRLIRSRRVGPATYHRLIAEYGNAAAALQALPDIAQAAGVRDYRPCPRAEAEAEIAAAARAGAWMLCHGTPDYPAALAALSDAPPVLWCVGDAERLLQPAVALVGARNASSLGQRMARAMAGGLGAAGYCVVSGLARGIDACAHAAALETGTIAVLAGGVDVIYPPENAMLATRIAEVGLLVSEAPMGLQPQARHFPGRNRIISGIALGVVVVEAALHSGSLITARDALDQGREVMAVPGHPFDARASGCNALLRDGATLVRGAEDVCAALAARNGGNSGGGAHPSRQPHGTADKDVPGRGGVASRAGATRGQNSPPDARQPVPEAAQDMAAPRATADPHRATPKRAATPPPQAGDGPRAATARGDVTDPAIARQAARTGAPAASHPLDARRDSGAGDDCGHSSATSSGRAALAGTGAPRHAQTGATAASHPPGQPVAGQPVADQPVAGAAVGRAARQPPAPRGGGAPANSTARDANAAARPLATTGQHPAGAATSRAPVPADRHAAPPAARAAQSPDRADAAPLRDAILARLSPSPLAEDQLIRDLARTAAQVAPALVLLELEGRVQRQPGGLLALCLPG